MTKELTVTRELGIKASEFATYHDGFAILVETELDAYKVAWFYLNAYGPKVPRTEVVKSQVGTSWCVRVYEKA